MSKAEEYRSPVLEQFLSEISQEEIEKTRKKMLLAVRIDQAMKARGWKKSDLAREMKKKPSVITRWLSGTHNFETDTLFDLEAKLEVSLVNLGDKPQQQVNRFHVVISCQVNTEPCKAQINPQPIGKAVKTWINNQPVC